jgi:hypothetical protein
VRGRAARARRMLRAQRPSAMVLQFNPPSYSHKEKNENRIADHARFAWPDVFCIRAKPIPELPSSSSSFGAGRSVLELLIQSCRVFDASNLSFLREDHFDNPMQLGLLDTFTLSGRNHALRDETASPPLYASLSSSVPYLGASAFTFSMNAA